MVSASKIGEHRILELSFQQDCLNRHDGSLAVQKQINELSGLKIIHLNHGLELRRNHQIRLDFSGQLNVPGRDSAVAAPIIFQKGS